MNWPFRPGTVVGISAALLAVAGALFFLPLGDTGSENQGLPRPVPAGDQEIVWLNAATNVSWERFVASAYRLQIDRPDLNLEIPDDANRFPDQSTIVPEFALRQKGKKGRMWFRWYKLTGDLGPGEWVQALARRNRPPLAIIGGGTSDRARDLAKELKRLETQFSVCPLLFITSATAVNVEVEQEWVLLMKMYPERTFRFCFTNRQMADAVTDFIWHQPDLRPDGEPFYMAQWKDDPYSLDLFDQFHQVLGPEGYGAYFARPRTIRTLVRDWGLLAGRTAVGVPLPGLALDRLQPHEQAASQPSPIWSATIEYSVGSYNEANSWELGAANRFLQELDQHSEQFQPLLVVPAMPQPARRLLRALLRAAPAQASRFVVATGDAIDFNTIYRDRNLAWPIQDLPVPLVFFCHRNPVDPTAFQPGAATAPPDPMGPTSTGTQDLLLYRDIVETVVRTAFDDSGLSGDAETMRRKLTAPTAKGGLRAFDELGNQRSGQGEFVVCLRPRKENERVLPEATLQIWNWKTDGQGNRRWQSVPVEGQPHMLLHYQALDPTPGAPSGP